VKAYANCKNQGECEFKVPDTLDGLLLGDLFSSGSLGAKCIYSYEYNDTVNGHIVDTFKYLSSIAVIWTSDIHFLKAIDLDSFEVHTVTPDFKFIKLPFDASSRLRVQKLEDGDNGRILIDVSRETVDVKSIMSGGSLQLDALRAIRNRVGQTIFVMRLQSNNGLSLEEVLDRPDMQDCPPTRPN
jgi:hypothetical protein